jgi:hypothetical protein
VSRPQMGKASSSPAEYRHPAAPRRPWDSPRLNGLTAAASAREQFVHRAARHMVIARNSAIRLIPSTIWPGDHSTTHSGESRTRAESKGCFYASRAGKEVQTGFSLDPDVNTFSTLAMRWL